MSFEKKKVQFTKINVGPVFIGGVYAGRGSQPGTAFTAFFSFFAFRSELVTSSGHWSMSRGFCVISNPDQYNFPTQAKNSTDCYPELTNISESSLSLFIYSVLSHEKEINLKSICFFIQV